MAQDSKTELKIIAVVQDGRLAYEALLFMASLRAVAPDVEVLLFEPQPCAKWGSDPRISDPALRRALMDLGADIRPIPNSTWAEDYPNGSKIDALAAAPAGQNFAFFDTDTIFLAPLDLEFPFEAPTGSLKRSASWPNPGPLSRDAIWRGLYDHFEVAFEGTLDDAHPPEDWQRYLYFNAGFFCGSDARAFGARLRELALEVARGNIAALDGQAIYPWLDQIVLPLAIAEAGGGRNAAVAHTIDEELTCHWRVLALFYAREAAWKLEAMERAARDPRICDLIAQYEPMRRLILEGEGQRMREGLKDQDFEDEAALRKAIKAQGLWLR